MREAPPSGQGFHNAQAMRAAEDRVVRNLSAPLAKRPANGQHAISQDERNFIFGAMRVPLEPGAEQDTHGDWTPFTGNQTELDPGPGHAVAAASPAMPARAVLDHKGLRQAALHDISARLVSRLTLHMRETCGLDAAFWLDSVARRGFSEGLSDLDEGSVVLCFGAHRGHVVAMLALPPELISAVLDLSLGSPVATGAAMDGQVSPLGCAVLRTVLAPLSHAIASDLMLVRVEADGRYAAAMAPPGAGRQLTLRMEAAGVEGEAGLVLLDEAIEPENLPETAPQPAQGAALPETLQDVGVALSARLASLKLDAATIAGLRPGQTLSLGIPPDAAISLVSGPADAAPLAMCEIGRSRGRKAVRITQLRGRLSHSG